MTHSAALFRASNLSILDYPFAAALASALNICDEAVVVVGQSEDETLRWVRSLARDYGGRVTVEQTTFTFDRGWQERWWEQASAATDAEWLMFIDADEVIHPQHAGTVRQLMQQESINLIRFPFVHLYATPSYQIHVALTHNTRLGRRSAGYRMRNWCHDGRRSACMMVVGDGEHSAHGHQGNDIVTVDFPILHYGWCRDARALAISQRKHKAWYADGDGLADGRIPDVEPYTFWLPDRLEAGGVTPWAGDHPDIMHPWFEMHEHDWQELEAEVRARV